MDRGRDRRYDDRDMSYGETYRPSGRGGRSPPRGSTYRGDRSPPPPRRARTPPYENNYQARSRGGYRENDGPRSRSPRRRSRSPIKRGMEDDNYRTRARTPPRAYERQRSPLPRRRQSRSPFNRDRSPPRQKKDPGTYRQRSPPPRQGRYNDERDGHEQRNYGPLKEESRRDPRDNNTRPRERSRTPRRSGYPSGDASPSSSRRSSPHVHTDRSRLANRSPDFQAMRHEQPPARRPSPHHVREQSPPYRRPQAQPSRRAQSPPPRRAQSPPFARPQSPPPRRAPSPLFRRTQNLPTRRAQSPPRRAKSPPRRLQSPPRSPVDTVMAYRDHSPPPRDRDAYQSNSTLSKWSNTQSTGPGHQDGEPRPPPTGPSRLDQRPPSGPASSSVATSGHAHLGGSKFFSAPTRPRGAHSFVRENPYPSPRGGRHFGGQSSQHQSPSIAPTGPRSNIGTYDVSSPRFERPAPSFSRDAPPFRPNNSSSTTYPRTQRFNTTSSHLSSLPSVIEGGKKLPSALAANDEKRLKFLEEEGRKIREQINEKQRIKRQGLREWDRMERESKREALKSELAEGHLERLSGEVGGAGGAY